MSVLRFQCVYMLCCVSIKQQEKKKTSRKEQSTKKITTAAAESIWNSNLGPFLSPGVKKMCASCYVWYIILFSKKPGLTEALTDWLTATRNYTQHNKKKCFSFFQILFNSHFKFHLKYFEAFRMRDSDDDDDSCWLKSLSLEEFVSEMEREKIARKKSVLKGTHRCGAFDVFFFRNLMINGSRWLSLAVCILWTV